jgi:hypothetical protein
MEETSIDISSLLCYQEHDAVNFFASLFKDKIPDMMAAARKMQGSGPAAATVDDQPADTDEAVFWEQAKTSGFTFNVRGDTGNPMGGRWSRALAKNKELKTDYQRPNAALSNQFRQSAHTKCVVLKTKLLVLFADLFLLGGSKPPHPPTLVF